LRSNLKIKNFKVVQEAFLNVMTRTLTKKNKRCSTIL
jgi:hypothetical protein